MDLKERIIKITDAGIADNTVDAYKNGLKYFWAWARITKNKDPEYPTPPDLIEAFIVENIEGFDTTTDRMLVEFGYKSKPGKLAIATIRHRVEAIGWQHRSKNLKNPARSERIRDLLRSAQRIESKGGRVPKKSLPITKDIVDKLIKSMDPLSLTGKRNRAILTFGFFTGGRRRSEIASAEYRFLSEHQGGYVYILHRSKTDQDGKGSQKTLWRKHAYPMKAWLKASGITNGYLFRSIRHNKISEKPITPQTINIIIKDHIELIGLNPKEYSAHGIRRGFVTTCARRGHSIFDIMQATGHRDIRTVHGYYQEGKASKNPVNHLE